MPNFDTIAAAKEYGKEIAPLWGAEVVTVNDRPIILCNTDKDYEDDLCSDIENAVINFASTFDDVISPDDEPSETDITDLVSEIRDKIINWYEKERNTKFVTVHDEY